MIMVILSAQESDANINKIVPTLFEMYPNMESLAVSNTEGLMPKLPKLETSEQKQIV
jgi:endonuclease-3